MKTRIILTLMLLLSRICLAQTPVSLNQVKIGDQVPDFELNKLLNYPKQSLKLNEFKGKILILDFWSTGCVSCVESWPKLHKLQEQFNNKIQIVLVNPLQDDKMILPLIKRWEKNFGKKMTLPIAYGEKKIDSLFPHSSVPHVVWIDMEGVVSYISGGSYLNIETIQGMLDKKAMSIYEKTDKYLENINFSKPLFINGNGGETDQIVYTSMISKYVPGIMGTTLYYSKKAFSAGTLTNASLVRMFRELYGKGLDKYGGQRLVPYARVILKTADTASIVTHLNGIFRFENLYNLQVTAQGKEISKEKIKKKMITDLELYFQVKTNWEKQKMKCLVVSGSSWPFTKYEKGDRVFKLWDSQITFNKITITDLFDKLLSNNKWYEFTYPVVDETGFSGELGNISFETDFGNYRLVEKALEKHGFRFSIEEREVDVLVVADDK